MAWDAAMPRILRVMINDLGAAPTYADASLKEVLVVAGFQVSLELDFSQDFVCDPAAQTISPDPTLAASKDDSFVNLTCLKAACILSHGEAVVAARQAIAIKDGSSSVDLRAKFGSLAVLLQKGWCAVYDDQKLEYQAGQTRVAGAAVMGPFRTYAAFANDRGLTFR